MKKISLVAITFILSTGCSYAPKSIKNVVNDSVCTKLDTIEDKQLSDTVKNSIAIKTSIMLPECTPQLKENTKMRVSVTGQGVAPVNTSSPAQAYALAKRAAIADAYRLLAEKIKGVHVEGQDFIKNMMVKRSRVRTSVMAMIRNANILETTFKEGLCEVEMEVTISHSQFAL